MMGRTWWLALLMSLLLVAVVGRGQVPADATYSGDRMCLLCHKQLNAEIVERYPQSGMANAMAEATDDNVVADFADAPFDRALVKYIFGAGKYQQAYLDAVYQVLPGKWIVADQAWKAFPAQDGVTECLGCHVTNMQPETKTFTHMGVGCESCHGPGSVHNRAMGAAAKDGSIVNPSELDEQRASMICGQCHAPGRSTDGTTAYPQGYLPGQDLDEHYDIRTPDGPGMNQQFEDLRHSPAHWEAGIGCVTCHDPHGETGHEYQLKDEITALCMSCHEPHLNSLEEHVTANGGTVTEGMTCATCHMPEGRHLFDRTQAPHGEAAGE